MKKLIGKTYIYKVLPPYKNWYSIMTDDGLNRNNIIIVGKKQLLKSGFSNPTFIIKKSYSFHCLMIKFIDL